MRNQKWKGIVIGIFSIVLMFILLNLNNIALAFKNLMLDVFKAIIGHLGL